jgi:hypothetical protein
MTQSVQLKKDDHTVVLYYPDVCLQEQRMNPNLLKPTGYVMHKQAEHFNICTLCTHRIYVFCICPRKNSDLFHLHKKTDCFYNRDEKCLQRGTDWVFKWIDASRI